MQHSETPAGQRFNTLKPLYHLRMTRQSLPAGLQRCVSRASDRMHVQRCAGPCMRISILKRRCKHGKLKAVQTGADAAM